MEELLSFVENRKMGKKMPNRKHSLIYSILMILLGFVAVLIPNEIGIKLYMSIPMVTTMIMMMFVSKEGRTKEGWKRIGLTRWGFKWWLLPFLLPITVLFLGYFLAIQLGYGQFSVKGGEIHWIPFLMTFFALIAFNTLTTSMGEEIGWRGYLQTQIISWGKNKAYLFIGMVWALWHMPILLLTDQYHHEETNKFMVVVLFTLTVIAVSFIAGELRSVTGSVWIASFFHSVHNTAWFMGREMVQDISSKLELIAGESGWIPLTLYGIVAIWIAIKNRNETMKVRKAPPLIG
jgi:uncharacterized protein